MKPTEKAIELVDKFHFMHVSPIYLLSAKEHSKQCALIAVNEILEVTEPYLNRHEPDYLKLPIEMTQGYWLEVKQEIEKL